MSLIDSLITTTTPAPPKMIIYGQPGVGKAQPLDAKVLTPNGYVAMGDLQLGDEVIGSNGKACKVLGIYPQGGKEVFRVTMLDGSCTQCTDDHLWLTQNRTERLQEVVGSVRPLSTIRKTLKCGTHFNHAIPRVCPVQFNEGQALSIHPWLLGIYLGDGHSSTSAIISNPEPDIQAMIGATLEAGDECTLYDKINLRITRKSQPTAASRLMTSLRDYGLAGLKSEDKFIPQPYLLASPESRLSLLQGLCDSDGYVCDCGSVVEYTTVSRQLAEDIRFLAKSLGADVTVHEKTTSFTYKGEKRTGQLAYRLNISMKNEMIPVRSSKHRARWKKATWSRLNAIRSVESVGVKVCQCIKVDALDSLYVTDDFIVTHNTTFAASANAILVDCENGSGAVPGLRRTPYLQTWPQMRQWLAEIATCPPGDLTALAIDTIDWMVQRIVEHVVLDLDGKSPNDITNTLGTSHGGYFKAREIVQNVVYRDLLPMLNAIADKGVAIILLAHAANTKVTSPEGFDMHLAAPDLPSWIAPPFIEWADAVLYATSDGGHRTMLTQGTNVVLAKNRYSLPPELPLSWPALMESMNNNQSSRSDLKLVGAETQTENNSKEQ